MYTVPRAKPHFEKRRCPTRRATTCAIGKQSKSPVQTKHYHHRQRGVFPQTIRYADNKPLPSETLLYQSRYVWYHRTVTKFTPRIRNISVTEVHTDNCLALFLILLRGGMPAKEALQGILITPHVCLSRLCRIRAIQNWIYLQGLL